VRPPILRIGLEERVVDNFAGGGGASTGIEAALERPVDIAINHDPEAIAMHRANHPRTRHYVDSVWAVDPIAVTEGRPVALAWFSPDCTFHSKARGAKPFRDRNAAKRRRGLAWVVIRWARAVKPRVICLENVEEFQDWGPLLDDGRPCPLRRGFTFRRWVAQLRNCGYEVEMRELRACDYGAPTTRKRLFIVARSDGRPIVWPDPTHGPGRLAYRTAAECIDWSLPCPSIFERKRPLAENTLRRIARGLRRYVIEAGEPFIIPVTHAGDARVHSIHEPMPTITSAHRGEKALVAPTLIQTGYGERPGQAPRALDLHRPLGTIVAGGAKHALVAAFLAKHYGGKEGRNAVGMGEPLATVTTVDHHAIVAAHLTKFQQNSSGQDPQLPLDTVMAGATRFGLVASHLLKLRGGLADHPVTAQDLREPAPTLTAGGTHLAEVRAFLLAYYGTDQDPQLQIPLPTVTTKHRFGLVTVHGQDYVIADIGMRMLEPHELFRAQSFPDGYVIAPLVDGEPLTKTAQVRMCGNAVPPVLPEAIVRAQFTECAAQAEAG
jgi:DNA (cytosine-5)-methyltransferase 1